MSAAEKMHQDDTTLYNITHSLYTCLSYQHIVLHVWSTLANLWDSLYYLREVTIHTMHYIDTATTGILSSYVLPVDLREMLSHIEETLPSIRHLPISSGGALHFYRYLNNHILITDEQFLLLIDVPIHDHTQQLEIYEVFNLDIPHRSFSAHYILNNRYLGIMHDETSAVDISEDQFKTCQKANRQILQLKHTPATTCQPTNLCISFICQVQGQHPEEMSTTDQKDQQYKHTSIYSSKCLDNNLTSCTSTIRNHNHLDGMELYFITW